ncbi:hypothetical protein EU524_00550 [Candidatus Thorarchaeota archaeon]|nr:MAG: hypothetical protein EU524_00550 [Candidatus Thorarchaeota archaeon]
MSDSKPSQIKFIDREARKIELEIGGFSVMFPLNPIPDVMYESMANAVDIDSSDEDPLRELYESGLTKPTISALNPLGSIFPINSAKKVIRLTLTDETIEKTIHELEGAELALQGRPFQETIEERIGLYQKTLVDDTKIDRFRLGAVEMFGDNTYRAIQRDPRVTVNVCWHTDQARTALSFQLNCVAEIVPPGDPFFRYMRVMRRLFSSRLLDLRNTTDYICAYKLWICETTDKSLTEKAGFVP